jgi:UDP-2,3-diacylglucosamine hydrolase
MIRVRSDETALFVSDVHLSEAQPETGAAFLAALAHHARGIAHLFILGDAFDAWVGDDALEDPGCDRLVLDLVDRLTELATAGTAVHYLHGNRDFLLGEGARAGRPGFEARSGARRLPDPCTIELHGHPAVLTHGDLLCTDDLDYLEFRRQARSPAWQAAFLARPLSDRLAAARAMRDESERSKSGKTMAIMDASPEAARQMLRDSGARLLIHGHTHRPARHRTDIDGEAAVRWVLPDWDAAAGRGGALLARDGSLEPVGDWPAETRSPLGG